MFTITNISSVKPVLLNNTIVQLSASKMPLPYEAWDDPKINWFGIRHHFINLRCPRCIPDILDLKLMYFPRQFIKNHPKNLIVGAF